MLSKKAFRALSEDMMLSGHTYFASLFSLAAYKLTGAIDMSSKALFHAV